MTHTITITQEPGPPVLDQVITTGGLLRRVITIRRICGHFDTVPVVGSTVAELERAAAQAQVDVGKGACDKCRVRH